MKGCGNLVTEWISAGGVLGSCDRMDIGWRGAGIV